MARARVTIGVALRLLGDEKTGADDPDLARPIDAIVRRVVSGEDGPEAGVPGWAANLDLTRFQPRGSYTRSAALQRYFRAVSSSTNGIAWSHDTALKYRCNAAERV
jgi:hypothetical protein